jgi:hypothetical protein
MTRNTVKQFVAEVFARHGISRPRPPHRTDSADESYFQII